MRSLICLSMTTPICLSMTTPVRLSMRTHIRLSMRTPICLSMRSEQRERLEGWCLGNTAIGTEKKRPGAYPHRTPQI